MCNEAARLVKKPGSGEWRHDSEWNRPSGHEAARKDLETKTPDSVYLIPVLSDLLSDCVRHNLQKRDTIA